MAELLPLTIHVADLPEVKMAFERAATKIDELTRALSEIADFDAFQGGPIAPRETPTSEAMREIARAALGGRGGTAASGGDRA